MKILFFGTPYFAEIVLKGLMESEFEVVGVVCQEDKPAGRGNKMQSPHIVQMAREYNLPVYQFEKLSRYIEEFKKIDYDYAVTASYGKILPKALLEIKPCINVHPSMLPKYRGATPIQTALLNGDTKTGVTIMKTNVGMDDGDIYVQKEEEILPEDDYNSLIEKLGHVGLDLLLETLRKIANGTAKLIPQDHENATFVKMIEKEDALLDFGKPADTIVNMVRAYVESPVAYFFLGEDRIKVYKAKVFDKTTEHKAGEAICTKKKFLIQAQDGVVEILRCQAPGGKVLDSGSFLNGYHFKSMVAAK